MKKRQELMSKEHIRYVYARVGHGMEGHQSGKGSMRERVMAAVAGNSRAKIRDLDRHGGCSTQTPVQLRGPYTQWPMDVGQLCELARRQNSICALDFGSNSVRALHYSLDMVEIRHAGSADLLVPPWLRSRFFCGFIFEPSIYTSRRSHLRLT